MITYPKGQIVCGNLDNRKYHLEMFLIWLYLFAKFRAGREDLAGLGMWPGRIKVPPEGG